MGVGGAVDGEDGKLLLVPINHNFDQRQRAEADRNLRPSDVEHQNNRSKTAERDADKCHGCIFLSQFNCCSSGVL